MFWLTTYLDSSVPLPGSSITLMRIAVAEGGIWYWEFLRTDNGIQRCSMAQEFDGDADKARESWERIYQDLVDYAPAS